MTCEQRANQMKREASLIAEDVEGFAVGVLGSGGVVLALVEEGSGLLAFEGVEVELDAIHGKDGRGFFALHRTGGVAADPRVGEPVGRRARRSRPDAACPSALSQRLAHYLRVHGLSEDLHRENVVVAIDDETGKEIGFAEDDAVGVGVVNGRPSR